jgi:RNA polymerase sigma factor (sigma-70 family)
MSEDEEIVNGVLACVPGSFEALVARHQKLVWHLVYRMVQHADDTRELCQEVFLRVHQRLHQFRFESTLSTWIGRIAFTVATRHLQRRRLPLLDAGDEDGPVLDLADDEVDVAALHSDAELVERLAEAVTALPPLQRTLVTLYHLEELGIAEVAQITGLPEGTVKNYLFRARLRLRGKLEHLQGTPS